MKLALQVVNDLERDGLIRDHAVGGAMALMFHDEPVATFDLATQGPSTTGDAGGKSRD